MNDDCFYLMEKYIPKNYWDDLMFMGYSNSIALYKHCDTRRYINIDSEGNFYIYKDNTYYKVEKDYAVRCMMS